jgi:peptide/nickel transport system substrate-binding protein
MWHTYDPDQANALLDSVGLDQRDADGYRLRADNGERLTLDLMAITGQFSPYPEIGEMMREQLREVGIDFNVVPTERSLATTQQESNSHQMNLWDNGGTDRLFSPGRNLFPIDPAHGMGPLYGAWYASNGAQGEEPFAELADWMTKWRSSPGLPEEDRAALGKELWATYVDQVFNVGLVGLSPATLGVRVVNNDLGNVPGRMIVGTDAWTESIGRPETMYFKTRNN